MSICLENDCYISALGMALTLPDICGKAKYPQWKKQNVGLRYKKWYDEYIGFREIPSGPHSEDFSYLSGEVVYSLRNCLLHQGTPNIDNTGSLQKVETNRFARADLEYKLLLVDDDMKTEALPQTNNIKTLVTLEDKIDIERKGQQSVQGTLYVRFACFGNGSLHALYDKSNGFYRRQLLLTTKEKPVGRVDDPFLIDKMRNEKEGILLWALEGLHRLIQNNYQFTISERTVANLKEAMEQGNNILGFLKSEGYFEIRQGAKCKSTDFYKVYERWCLDNLEKPLAASTFIHHLKDNQKSLGIVYDDKCIGTNRGFHNVDIDLFLPIDVPSPWDYSSLRF